MLARRPGTDEYGPFYAGYVARIPDGAWWSRLEAQPTEYRALLAGTDDVAAAAPLAAGKWSLLDVLGHLTDTERVFAFRLLWFARSESSGLPGFDQDAWVCAASGQRPTVSGLLDEFEAVRRATLLLAAALPDAVADRRGVANGVEMTVRALAWVIPGHAQHHLELLRGA